MALRRRGDPAPRLSRHPRRRRQARGRARGAGADQRAALARPFRAVVEQRHDPLPPRSARRRRCGTLARSEEHTSELQSLMRISYAVFCLKKKKQKKKRIKRTLQTNINKTETYEK